LPFEANLPSLSGATAWAIHRWQASGRGATQNLLPLPRSPREGTRLRVHAVRTLIATRSVTHHRGRHRPVPFWLGTPD
jgi:hypothetical protein